MGQNLPQMFKDKLIGFFRLTLINLIRKGSTHKLFRSGILSYAPPVWLTVLVCHVSEVACDHIALLLQSCDRGIKTFIAALAVISELFEFFGYNGSMTVKQIIQHLVSMFCKPFIIPCIEIITVTTIVCKVRKPITADVYRLVFKKLSIGTACFLYDRTFPVPSIPLCAVGIIPMLRSYMLLYGKALDSFGRTAETRTCLSLLLGQPQT